VSAGGVTMIPDAPRPAPKPVTRPAVAGHSEVSAPPSVAAPAGSPALRAASAGAGRQRKTQPMRAKRRRIPLALTIAVAMASGLISGLIVKLLTQAPGSDHALAGVPQVRAGASTVRFAWQTRVPSRSALVLWPEGRTQSDGLTVTAGAAEAPALDHAVVASGLTAGTAYRFRLQYDDGGLSPDSFAFSTRGEADLVSGAQVHVIAPARARVSWKRRAPVAAGVRVVGAREATVCWPAGAQSDSVEVPLDPMATNRLEICFREFESPPPPTGTPERVKLAPVPGPDLARRWLTRALANVKDREIKACAADLVAIPYRLVKGLSLKEAPPGDELVRRYSPAQHEQVIAAAHEAVQHWLAHALERSLPNDEAGTPDVDVMLGAVAAWLADESRPADEREVVRETLARLTALDAAGQLIAGVDLVGVDELVSSRTRVERRAEKLGTLAGGSLIAPLALPRTPPLPLPIAVWGSEQLSIMNTMSEGHDGQLAQLEDIAQKLALPVTPGDGRRWYRLAPVPADRRPSAGLHVALCATNLDPSLSLTLAIGGRELVFRNTLAAYAGYVNLHQKVTRDALEGRATTLTMEIAPGVLADEPRTTRVSLEAFTAENTEGDFSTPPVCWIHELAVRP